MVSKGEYRIQKSGVRRKDIILSSLFCLLSSVSYLTADVQVETGAKMWGELKEERVCVKCHARIPAQKIMMKEDKRCIECHGPEELDREKTDLREQRTDSLLPVGLSSVSLSSDGLPSDMVLIPAGEFMMGNNGRSRAEGGGDLDERPTRKVYVDAFYIDGHEVTNADYKIFVDATGHRMPVKWKNGAYPPGKGDHPVVYVSWTDAYSYCRWSGKRLPSEEEWEKAARGTDGRHFPWGNEFDPMKANTPQYWLNIGKKGDTMPVGSFKEGKSPYGLYDMAGNVYEWTENWYKPYPGNRFPNVHYGEKNKVMRGGSWYDCLSYGCGLSSPVYNRTRFSPEIRNNNTGFRCAKDQ